jgi:L-cysteate sulfo-lyase
MGGDQLWIKRDDLTGLGGGGNKVRKLERILAAAASSGADALITSGAAQSNHARLTAAAGARLGIPVTLVLSGGPGNAPAGNVLLDGVFGASIRWAGNADEERLASVVDEVAADLVTSGARPYVIPLGGSSRDGALGYVDAAAELRAQFGRDALSVVAVGSGGTMAGLVAGLGHEHVLGVDTGAVTDPRVAVARLVAAVTGEGADPGTLRLRTDQVGAGYGVLTDDTAAAIRLAARTEGIVLDPIYTGRAMAGLIAGAAEGEIEPGVPVVFWHTGGLPGLFGHPDASVLTS